MDNWYKRTMWEEFMSNVQNVKESSIHTIKINVDAENVENAISQRRLR